MRRIVYHSSLPSEHREDLEQILFFNAHQGRTTDSVSFVAERYGLPKIHVDEKERLRVELSSTVETQTLFAVLRGRRGERPVGVAVYTRENNAFVVLFVAVHEEFCSRGPKAHLRVLMNMTNQVKAIARRVKGVDSLLVYLGRKTPMRVRVRPEIEPPVG